MLVAGERGGKLASLVFSGLGIGALWKSLSWTFALFRTEVGYSMARTGEGLFFLSERPGEPPLCAPLELDDFVAFVNKLGPQTPRKVSKLDVAFEKQLVKKKPAP